MEWDGLTRASYRESMQKLVTSTGASRPAILVRKR
jgi:hypothetical protein